MGQVDAHDGKRILVPWMVRVGQTLWMGQMSYDVFLGVCTSCQDRPDCADWRRQQHHTCETLII